MEKPLALVLKPKSLKDIVGQTHLIGENKILTNMVKNKKIFSMILYGNPGTGKTSIASAIVNDLNCNYRFLNATLNNKQDLQIVIEEAKMLDGMILIMDEIHRMNKDKQDLLLPCLESGLLTLIGMTTSNPYHKINPAIRSRCQIFKLETLTTEDIKQGLVKATETNELKDIKIDDNTLNYISNISGGDLRFALNLLEVAYYFNEDHTVTEETIKSINNKPNFFHDKNETGHYDVLSGLQKSIRGSDVDAALHYLARLIIAEDLDSIYRRLSVICYEDIGLANPSLGPKLDAAINACERVGLPEARIILSNITIEMALSPKSNTAYLAIAKAINDIETKDIGEIPTHLKSPYIGYKYPHDYKGSIVKQQYLPDNIKDVQYYLPKETSKYEIALKTVKEKVIGNVSASGTEIIKELGERQMETGELIVYTSADSVLQIAAHEGVIPLKDLYEICRVVRKLTNLRDEWRVGRVIARPYKGKNKDDFVRTSNRKDFALDPPSKSILEKLSENKLSVISIGKIYDIFNGKGITKKITSANNKDGVDKLLDIMDKKFTGLCFTNLNDFDTLYGHRRDISGYARAIEEFDVEIPMILNKLNNDDLLIITADHGNDPTFKGTDHTRENTPVLLYSRVFKNPKILPIMNTFADIGATIAENFEIDKPMIGTSYLNELK